MTAKLSASQRRAIFLREMGLAPEWLPRQDGVGIAAPDEPENGDGTSLSAPPRVSTDRPQHAAQALPLSREEGGGLPNLGTEEGMPNIPAVDVMDWETLRDMVADCRRCGLCESRTQTVFGVGDQHADWLLIGEAPGENEDLQGEPFVGQAGKLLDNMLQTLGLARGRQVYIANVLKCRPPRNRDPAPDEVMRCEPYLKRQIALIRPKLILVMGRFAAQTVLKTDAAIGKLRGQVHQYEGVPVVVTYHPAYLLRNLPDKAKAWEDLCLARQVHQRQLAVGMGAA